MAEDRHARAAEEARRELERVSAESEVIGTSSFVRTAKRAHAHFAAAEAPSGDKAEVWGRRIGRGLSAVFVVFLILYLVRTYVLA